MPRKLTTYKRPSILTMIENAPNVETLYVLRHVVAQGLVNGRIDPDEHTARKWHEAILAKVITFIRSARTGREATRTFNTVFTWYSHEAREALRAIVTEVTRPMPSEADAWRNAA